MGEVVHHYRRMVHVSTLPDRIWFMQASIDCEIRSYNRNLIIESNPPDVASASTGIYSSTIAVTSTGHKRCAT